ncbi:MAG: DMT family transporter [Chromatiales bacterium]|nr:DMT family transporter [Chromatiales bacterium]
MSVIALVLMACAFFAGISVLARFLTVLNETPLHPFQISFGRYVVAVALLLPFILLQGHRVFRTATPVAYLFRCSASVGAGSCIFASVAVMPLAEVTAITYSSPLFVLLFAAFFLREKVSAGRWTVTGTGFVGVLLMTAPGVGAFQPMALIALLGALFMAGELTALRHITLKDSAATALILTNIVGLCISGALALTVWRTPNLLEYQLLIGIGAVTVTGQAMFVYAAKWGEASLLAPLFYSTLIYAAVFGYVFFDEAPTLRSTVGAAFIVAAGLALGWLERRARS